MAKKSNIDFHKAAQPMNPRDPAALAAAGFGDPSAKFNLSDSEMTEVAAIATQVEAVNTASGIPVPKPHPVQKLQQNPPSTVKSVPDSNRAPVEEEPAGEESDFVLSEDPAVRLGQMAIKLKEISPNAPTAEMLARWKAMHGELFVLYLFDRAYIYRYLKRVEWTKMNQDESFSQMTQDQVEEYIVDRCLLWPSYTTVEKASLPAGTIPSLSEQIRLNSMFLDAARLSQFTVKL